MMVRKIIAFHLNSLSLSRQTTCAANIPGHRTDVPRQHVSKPTVTEL